MCSFIRSLIHSFAHSFNTISLLTPCLSVGCCLHITGSLSRAGVSWPVQAFLPPTFSMGRGRWRGAYEHVKVQGEAGRESSQDGMGRGESASSDPTRFLLGKLADKGPFLWPLLQKPSTCHLRGRQALEASQLSAAASFKSGKQQGAGWLLQVVSCLPQEASGNWSRFLPSPSKWPEFKEATS